MCIQPVFSQVTEMTEPLLVDLKKSKIITRFTPPQGYFWMKEQSGSFGEYLVKTSNVCTLEIMEKGSSVGKKQKI